MNDLFNRFGTTFAQGDVLFREGEPGDVMYVLQSGAIRISVMVGGEDRTIAVLGPGEFVGEMALLNGKPRTATATVVEDARCLVISARRFEEMVANSTEISLRLIQKLAKRLESADALIEILMHRDVRARVMLGILRHAEGFGEQTDAGVRLRLTPTDLAREVAVDELTVDEVVSRLRRLRLAHVQDNGELIVEDVERLREFLEFLKAAQKFDRESNP
ncbi:MAG: Crp/Fnr family transcriptional regulator [Polyangiaceae bacterium]